MQSADRARRVVGVDGRGDEAVARKGHGPDGDLSAEQLSTSITEVADQIGGVGDILDQRRVGRLTDHLKTVVYDALPERSAHSVAQVDDRTRLEPGGRRVVRYEDGETRLRRLNKETRRVARFRGARW